LVLFPGSTSINLLCVASQHDGILPPLADLAFTLRNTEDKITALLDDLVEKGLIDVTSDDRYTPHNWASRQYKSDVSNDRVQRHRQRKRNVTATPPDQTRTDNRTEAVTALVEVNDEAALAAWDAWGIATRGKGYPRDRWVGGATRRNGRRGTRPRCTRCQRRCAMADIIPFDRARPRPQPEHVQASDMLIISEPTFRVTPRQRAGRRRNHLRHHADRVSLAVTIAGKLANGCADQLGGWGDHVAILRRGADAARFLADEIDRVVAREEITPRSPPVLTPDEVRRAHESLAEKDRVFISEWLTLVAKTGDEPPPAA
jgi:hypothetical protein